MTRRARHDGFPTDGTPTIEVPLSGMDPAGADPEGEQPEPNWRRLVAIASLAGAGLGIVASVIILAADSDGDETGSATTLDPTELSESIEAPPTLPPAGGEPTTATAKPVEFDPIEAVSTLPPVEEVDPAGIEGFRLEPESLAPPDSVPLRSVTEYVVGVDGYVQVTTTVNDPITGRYLSEIEIDGTVQRSIYDPGTDSIYAETDRADRPWMRFDEAVLPADLIRNLQLGPLRRDTFEAITARRVNPLVAGEFGEQWREYLVVMDAAAVPEWVQYALAAGVPEPTVGEIGLAVYVDRDGTIRRVSGSWAFGNTTQQIVHTIEPLDEPPVIELPDPDLVLELD